jgi:hypothetical protein
MKQNLASAFLLVVLGNTSAFAQSKIDVPANSLSPKKYFLDIHHLTPGKVTDKDVAGAHTKDLEKEKKYGVHFIKYWFSAKQGLVYCLASSPDTESLRNTHAEAHGLLPDKVYEITPKQAKSLQADGIKPGKLIMQKEKE